MTKDNPLNVVVTESALPYVALVLSAAQQIRDEHPEEWQFARGLEEAARYFEGLILAQTLLPEIEHAIRPRLLGDREHLLKVVNEMGGVLAKVEAALQTVRAAADGRER